MADCSPDYPVLGMQAGEQLATLLRLVALIISISVLFPWLSSERRGRMRIFFLHWFSGVMYVVSQFLLSVMVLNCWSSKADSGPFVYFLKFTELAVLNLWSISSFAIAILIASIVQSFAKFRRVPTVIGSARTAWCCVLAAVLATVLSSVFWNGLLITGGYFWVTNTENESHARWITLSFGATQTLAGILMAVAVLFTVTGERLASLKVCCGASQRVKFHFILTIFGTFVYLYNGIVLMVDEFSDAQVSKRLVIIGWCSRYVHVIADTGIIFGAFYALEAKEGAQDATRRTPPFGAGLGDASHSVEMGATTETPSMRQSAASTYRPKMAVRPGPPSSTHSAYNVETGLRSAPPDAASDGVGNGSMSITDLTTPPPMKLPTLQGISHSHTLEGGGGGGSSTRNTSSNTSVFMSNSSSVGKEKSENLPRFDGRRNCREH